MRRGAARGRGLTRAGGLRVTWQNDKTPLDLAVSGGKFQVAALLREVSARALGGTRSGSRSVRRRGWGALTDCGGRSRAGRRKDQASGRDHDVSLSRVRAAGAAGRRGGRSLRLAAVWRPGHCNAVCARGRGLGGDCGAASARATQPDPEEGEGASRLTPAPWARFASVMIWFASEGFWSSFKWRFKAGATGSVQRGFAGSGPGLLAALGRSGSLAWPSGFGNTSCGSVPPAPHVPATACTQGAETFLKARRVSLLADE